MLSLHYKIKRNIYVIHNDTNGEIKIKVSEVDNHDWDGNSRSDKVFNDAVIGLRTSKKERQEINAKSSSAMSTMTIQQDAMSDKEETKEFDMANEYKIKLTGGKRILIISISNKRDS